MSANLCPNCHKPGREVEAWVSIVPGKEPEEKRRFQCPEAACMLLVYGGPVAGRNGARRLRTWVSTDSPQAVEK